MKKSLRVFCALVLCLAVSTCEDAGPGAIVHETIVDGNLDLNGLFPHVVLVDGGCTGTVIGPRQVLSAAHCFCKAQDGDNGGWLKNASYCNDSATVTVTGEGEGATTSIPATVSIHPGYIMVADDRGSLVRSEADLAMLELEQCVPDTALPVSLVAEPPAVAPGGVSLGRIVGFGNNTCDAKHYLVQRWWGDAFVTGVDSEFLEVSSVAEIAGEDRTGAVSWQGDSGGPLLLDPEGVGWEVAGVLSKGTCGIDDGDISWYTNIETYRAWITEEYDRTDISACSDDIPPTIHELHLSYQAPPAGVVTTAHDVGLTLSVEDPGGTGVDRVWATGMVATTDGCPLPTAQPEAWGDLEGVELTLDPEASADEPVNAEGVLLVGLAAGQRGCVGAVAWDLAGNHSGMVTGTIHRCTADCNGHGTCDHSTGVCLCEHPYSGEGCESCTPNCVGRFCGDDGCGGRCGLLESPDCNDHGACDAKKGTCLCEHPYSGDHCEVCTLDCAGKNCGDDGCGGSCGLCDTAPETACELAGTVPSSGDMLVNYSLPGTCTEGICAFPKEELSCAPYGCHEEACLPKCLLLEHSFQDFALTPAPEPSSSDKAYVVGTLQEVEYFCDSSDCQGTVNTTPIDADPGDGAPAFSAECNEVNNQASYSYHGSVAFVCGSGPDSTQVPPAEIAVMLQCYADRYLCPDSTVEYSAFNGVVTVSDCHTTMGTNPELKCGGTLQVFFKVKHPNTDLWYITEPHKDEPGGGFPCAL